MIFTLLPLFFFYPTRGRSKALRSFYFLIYLSGLLSLFQPQPTAGFSKKLRFSLQEFVETKTELVE